MFVLYSDMYIVYVYVYTPYEVLLSHIRGPQNLTLRWRVEMGMAA